MFLLLSLFKFGSLNLTNYPLPLLFQSCIIRFGATLRFLSWFGAIDSLKIVDIAKEPHHKP